MFTTFLRDESGSTMVEHSLLVAFVGLSGITFVAMMGGLLDGVFGEITQALHKALSAASGPTVILTR